MEIREVSPKLSEYSSSTKSKYQNLFNIVAILYSLLILISGFLDWNLIINNLQDSFGITPANFIILNIPLFLHQTLEIIYPGFLKFALLIFVILSLWSGLVLSQGRSVIESIALFMAYVMPKPNSLWGKIYNKNTHNEIPFATIRIISENILTAERKFETEAVSDLFGRYRISFNAQESKRYYLTCKSENYDYYEIDLDTAGNEHVSIFSDIELSPLESELGLLRKLANKILFVPAYVGVRYLYIVSILSAIVTLQGLIREFTLGPIVYFILMSVSLVWNTYILFDFRNRKIGKLIYKLENLPAYDINLSIGRKGNRIASSKTNSDGVVNFSADPGVYELSLLGANNCEFDGQKNYVEVEVNKKGFLTKDVFLNKLNLPINNKIQNPFS